MFSRQVLLGLSVAPVSIDCTGEMVIVALERKTEFLAVSWVVCRVAERYYAAKSPL